MFLTYNEGKSVVAERFIRTLRNVYFDVLDAIVNKYNNTVHRAIKMKPIDVTSDSYAEYNKDCNEKDPKFGAGDLVRIQKCKNVFAKGYTQNWSEEICFVIKAKNIVPWTYVISDFTGEPITGNFYEKELQKTSQEKCRVEKVIKRKGCKLYVKWKRYNNSFNNCINKKCIV